jgi:hypothetical protein
MRISLLAATLALAMAGMSAPLAAATSLPTVPPSGVPGIGDAQLTPAFWVARLTDPDRPILDAAAIAAQNDKVQRLDPSMHDVHGLPASLPREQVKDLIEKLSKRPSKQVFDVAGKPVEAGALDAIVDNLALDKIAEQTPTRYGLVVERALLRTFPTSVRVFSRTGDTDIDRFQEAGLFPGEPVAIMHASRDGQWLFVVSPRYAAWVERKFVAEGPKSTVFEYVARKPYRVVTGGKLDTVFTPDAPAVSERQLDMSVRVPLATDLPADKPVNGQSPYASYTVALPVRGADGSLAFSPALIQRNQDTAPDYLPLTRANIVRQAFKFLGERYGWGHSYNGRDCSGFVSDVYRSMGVLMPRNTRDQSISPGLEHRAFTEADSHDARQKAALALEVGDLVYIPGHVMMVIGRVDGEPYVIHDTGGLSYRQADGTMRRIKLNEVSVSPLMPLMFNDKQSYVDRMTSIVRIRP